jgi:hypothetical protein
MPGVHQPDPPGLIHDDLRLLPPWRGSSLFGGFFRRGRFFVPRWLRNVIFNKTYQMGLFGCPQARIHPQMSWLPWRGVGPRPQADVMTAANGILSLVDDQSLRDDVDRVAAAVGLPVVHAADASGRNAWTGAVAVLLDAAAARRCADRALPRRGRVVLVVRAEPIFRRPSRWVRSGSSRCPRMTAS